MYHLAKSLYRYATSKEEYSILLLGLDNAGKTTLLNRIKQLYLPTSTSPESSLLPSSSSSISAPNNNNNNNDNSDNDNNSVGKTVPTIGQNVSTITLPDMYLKIWDVGGQLSMRGLWQSYYASCHAIVFVVDSSDVGTDADVSKLPGFFGGGVGGGTPSGKRTSSYSFETRGPTSPGTTDTNNPPRTPLTPTFFTTAAAANPGRLDECARVLESVLHHADAVGVPLLVLANKQDREDCVEVVRIKEGLVRKVFEGEKGGGVRDSRVLPVSALRGTGVGEAVEWVRTRVKWNKEARPPVMR